MTAAEFSGCKGPDVDDVVTFDYLFVDEVTEPLWEFEEGDWLVGESGFGFGNPCGSLPGNESSSASRSL